MSEKDNDSAGREDGEEVERVVVANGLGIDKRYFYEVLKRAALDTDIRRLSLLGPPLWALIVLSGAWLFVRSIVSPSSLLTLVGSVLTGMGTVAATAGNAQARQEAIQRVAVRVNELSTTVVSGSTTDLATALLLALVAIAILFIGYTQIWELLDGITETFERSFSRAMNVPVVLRAETWQNLNYWHPFTSHLSDRDPLAVLSNLEEADVSSVYADEPHYKNVFVDSIYLEIDAGGSSRNWELLYGYRGRYVRRAVLFAVALLGLVALDGVLGVSSVPALASIDWPLVAVLAGLAVIGHSARVAVLGGVAGIGTAWLGALTPRVVTINANLFVLLAFALVLFVVLFTVFHPRARKYVVFNRWFLANSAGLSTYNEFLNSLDIDDLYREDDRNVLSNSFAGYGLFYLSELLYRVFGTGRYTVTADSDALCPDEQDPTQFHEPIGDLDAAVGAMELLWSAVPASSVAAAHGDAGDDDSPNGAAKQSGRSDAAASTNEGESAVVGPATEAAETDGGETIDDTSDGDADVSVTLAGVDYYTIRNRKSDGWRDRIANVPLLGDLVGEVESEERKRFERALAGSRKGIRVPIKKFMSVPDGTPPTVLDEGPMAVASLYEPDSWRGDRTHTVLLGGGEHQQGINKLVLSMKAKGYDNVDVLENAFVGEDEDAADAAEFPTEYFVSFVGGDNEFVRDVEGDDALEDREVFLYMRHRTEADRDTHLIIGMSAVATKTGFLYWHDRFANDVADDADGPALTELEYDTLHVIHHPSGKGDAAEGLAAGSFPELEVGQLYLDTTWIDDDPLSFDLAEDVRYDGVTNDDGIDIRYQRLEIDYEAP